MEPIVLKVYNKDYEEQKQIGYLMIIQKKIKDSLGDMVYYNAVYIPTGCAKSIPYNISSYSNLLEVILNFEEEGYYLKPEDMQQFTAIAKLQFKQILEKITDPSGKTQDKKTEEDEEENTILCVKCGKDPGCSFFRLSDGPYCLECYREHMSCIKEKEVEVKDKEIENCIKKGKCDRCGQVKPIEGEEGEQQLCYHCFYDLDTEEKA